MNLPVAISSCLRVNAVRINRLVAVVAVSVVLFAQAQPRLVEGGDISRWTAFASRAGWTIRYPPDLHISSCRQCEDPTDPDVAVAFSRFSGQIIVMIEPLADKGVGLSTSQWLNEVGHDTVLSPVFSEQSTFIDGVPALIVVNGRSDSEKTENIYISHGAKTFAVRFPRIQDASIRSICHQMLSTFRFSSQ
jgi:hypothetical protein